MRKNITISLPEDMADEIDQRSSNRSRFVLEALQAHIEQLRRDELDRSLRSPHPESGELADADLSSWVAAGTDETGLVDPAEGQTIRWQPGRGWIFEDA
ncbi:MAG: CopG family ribbon-helix-helix protein [Actinomycetota bacterium]